jgi:ferrous iron transport protein B
MTSQSQRQITIALAGQPNVGKSTVFNMLTGLNQHVGNWPGKTIEQKTGQFHHNGTVFHLVDLPGTYSLSANSEEERIARDYLIHHKPDVIIAVVDAATLERSLYLVAEILMLNLPVVVGLNMMDVASREGVQIEPHVLEAAMRVPVVPMVAAKNQGVRELIEAAERLIENPAAFSPNRPLIRPDHQPILAQLRILLNGKIPSPYPEDWVALKLLEGDEEIAGLVKQAAPQAWEQVHSLLMQHEDAFLDIVGGRYEWVERMVRAAAIRPRAGAITMTDRLDRIATHPLAGLLLLLGIFALVFWLTYALATPLVDWLDAGIISPLSSVAASALSTAPLWLSGLLVDGIISGAGTVLTFLPILVIFFIALGVLEDVGYMARAAYVMDRFMHWMGLHGKSFLPLFLGFGCNVPAVMGARILEDRRSRLLTILLTPLVPCTARMAVVAFLVPAFFKSAAALVSWGLVAFNIFLVLSLGIVINRLVFRGERSAFIMEMPVYHLPNLRTIGLFVWHKTVAFVRKAGSLIVIFSALLWALSVIPGGDIQDSLLATFGRWMEPIGRLMGLGDWRIMVALLSSFIAKENTIAALSILYRQEGSGLAALLAVSLPSSAALALLVVQMTFIPCLATMSVIHQETASWKWTLFNIGLLLFISFLAGIGTYWLASLFLGR